MGKKRVGRYPEAFRRMAVGRMRNCANVSALVRELDIDRTVLYHWQRLAGEQGTQSATSPVRELRKQVRDLKRLLAEKTLEADFFKGALQKVEARRRSREVTLARWHLRANPGSDAYASELRERNAGESHGSDNSFVRRTQLPLKLIPECI